MSAYNLCGCGERDFCGCSVLISQFRINIILLSLIISRGYITHSSKITLPDKKILKKLLPYLRFPELRVNKGNKP